MSKLKLVQLDEDTNNKLDEIVESRQKYSFNRVTKKGAVAEMIAKAYKKEIK